MPTNDEADTGELRKTQGKRETAERKLAATSDDPAEERQHARRADKASYLEEKLAEREQSEREE